MKKITSYIKPIYFVWVLFIPVIALVGSCRKENIDNSYGLPNISSEGYNRFGCLVNGKAYVARDEYGDLFSTPPLICYIDKPVVSLNTLDIHKEDDKKNKRQMTASIEVRSDLSVGTFALSYYEYGGGDDCFEYKTGLGLDSDIHITRFDPPGSHPRVVSGTFSCKVKEVDCGDIIDITDGRFDVTIR